MFQKWREKLLRIKALKELLEFQKTKNPIGTEEAVGSIFIFSDLSEFIPVLITLLQADWHQRHEDIVLLLQNAKDPRAIAVLKITATLKFNYLDYDNSHALARKCTWALADIGTKTAKKALEEISENHDYIIANYAKRRLERWSRELNRKSTI